MDPGGLDELDQAIVNHLVSDGRMSFKALGDAVSLSANATADRVRSLQRRGVILGFTALLGDSGAGRTIEAVVDLRLRDNVDRPRFERRIRELPSIAGAVHLTGPFDYQLRLSCAEPAQIDATIATLKDLAGVRDTQTRVVLRRVL